MQMFKRRGGEQEKFKTRGGEISVVGERGGAALHRLYLFSYPLHVRTLQQKRVQYESEKTTRKTSNPRAKSRDRETPTTPTKKRKGKCEVQRSRRGAGVEVEATTSFFALGEGRIACHLTSSCKNPMTRRRLYLSNAIKPILHCFLVL